MFVPRLSGTDKPQKRRCLRSTAWGKRLPTLGGLARVGTYAQGSGFLAAALVERMFVWAKRFAVFPRFSSRFWVNIQTATPVTRKGRNMRMGKGKGKRGRLQAKVHPLTWLLAFSGARVGALRNLATFTRARCAFAVGVVSHVTTLTPTARLSGPSWATPVCLQTRYIRQQLALAADNIAQVKRRPLAHFYSKLFLWHGAVPRAVVARPWQYRRGTWAYLRKARRRRLGFLSWPQGGGFVRQLRGWRRYTSTWPAKRQVVPSVRWAAVHHRWFRSVQLPTLGMFSSAIRDFSARDVTGGAARLHILGLPTIVAFCAAAPQYATEAIPLWGTCLGYKQVSTFVLLATWAKTQAKSRVPGLRMPLRGQGLGLRKLGTSRQARLGLASYNLREVLAPSCWRRGARNHAIRVHVGRAFLGSYHAHPCV